MVPNVPPLRDLAESLRPQFAAIGVTVAIERISSSEWPTRVFVRHEFDATLVSGTQGPDPDQLRRRFLTGTETSSYMGYDDPDFRAAVERGARAVDLRDRALAYYRAQELLARDVPFIPLAETVKVIVHNRRVSGLPQLEARSLVGSFDFSLVKLGATSR